MKLENSRLRIRLSYIESQLKRMATTSYESSSNQRITRQETRLKQERMRELTMDKKAIDNYLLRIIYPILTRIPVEITSEIFLHCLPALDAALPSPNSAPLLLGRICRTWRDIAYTNPRLWAVMKICSWRQTDWVENWLSRAGGAPLSLSLEHSLSYCLFSKGSCTCARACPSSAIFDGHWANLTSFRGDDFTFADCIALLALAPRLIHCEFYSLTRLHHPTTHVLLAELEDLTLDTRATPSTTPAVCCCPPTRSLSQSFDH
ncbi:hypothetical protein C8R45DRAFT_318783 [Mycena sanguinolenta]|nr:hypothetical protein C8R45DRAFT_318783 [Mycena sanguinolenta]